MRACARVRVCVRAWPYTHVARVLHANVLYLGSDWHSTYCQLQPKGIHVGTQIMPEVIHGYCLLRSSKDSKL